MKRCPECRRDYYDDSLLYCLDDGTGLLEGPANTKELPTEIIPGFKQDDLPTIQLDSGSLRTESGESKKADKLSTRLRVLIVVGVIGILALSGALAAYFLRDPASPSVAVVDRDKAQEYFLRGKTKVGNAKAEENDAAIKFLEQAVAADPNFAEAWALLAQAYNLKSFQRASSEERTKLNADAEYAVEKALSLNPNLAGAHFSRALILWTSHNRFPHEQAIRAFKRAVELDPNLDDAHHWLAVIYYHIGLFEKAQEEVERSLTLNPNNTMARFRIAAINVYRGQFNDALAAIKTVPSDVNPVLVDRMTADVLFRLGRTDEAAAVVEEFFKKYKNDEGGNITSVQAMLFAKAGKSDEAEAAIQRAIEIGTGYGHFHHTAYNIAGAYALLNRPSDAVKWLKAAAEDGFPCYPYFTTDKTLDNIRGEPAFVEFMAEQKAQWEKFTATL